MVGQEVLDSQLKTDRFPFPSEGDITLKVRNANYTLGPVMWQGQRTPTVKSGKQVSDNVTFANGFPRTNWLALDGLVRQRARQSLLRPKRYPTS